MKVSYTNTNITPSRAKSQAPAPGLKMGVIRPPRQAVLPSSGRSSDTSGAATPATQPNTDTESVASSGAATPRLVPATAAHPGVCPVQVRRKYLSVAKNI